MRSFAKIAAVLALVSIFAPHAYAADGSCEVYKDTLAGFHDLRIEMIRRGYDATTAGPIAKGKMIEIDEGIKLNRAEIDQHCLGRSGGHSHKGGDAACWLDKACRSKLLGAEVR